MRLFVTAIEQVLLIYHTVVMYGSYIISWVSISACYPSLLTCNNNVSGDSDVLTGRRGDFLQNFHINDTNSNGYKSQDYACVRVNFSSKCQKSLLLSKKKICWIALLIILPSLLVWLLRTKKEMTKQNRVIGFLLALYLWRERICQFSRRVFGDSIW